MRAAIDRNSSENHACDSCNLPKAVFTPFRLWFKCVGAAQGECARIDKSLAFNHKLAAAAESGSERLFCGKRFGVRPS